MKSLSTLATIGLLFFACKLCSFTGNTNRPISDSSPSPQPLMYARELIKPQLGSFTLLKSYTREETRKTASGFAITALDRSTDAATGEYKSPSVKSVILMACAYSSQATPESLVYEMEREMRQSSAWRTVTNVPRQTGKRVEGEDTKGNGLVLWCNGQWLFITIGDSLSDASSLANAVGY